MIVSNQPAPPLSPKMYCRNLLSVGIHMLAGTLLMMFCGVLCFAQNQPHNGPEPAKDNQINVNWFYGSYVPKEVPLESLNSHRRLKLYVRQTYTGFGIYIKTTLFAIHDQVHGTYPEWGDGFDAFAKRFGTRQAEFIIQNSVIALGDGLLGWEPRYDRCRCDGFWPRTRHAIVRKLRHVRPHGKILATSAVSLRGSIRWKCNRNGVGTRQPEVAGERCSGGDHPASRWHGD
jgi:hypothetical protein